MSHLLAKMFTAPTPQKKVVCLLIENQYYDQKIFSVSKRRREEMDKGGGVCIVHCCVPYVLTVIGVITYGNWIHQ